MEDGKDSREATLMVYPQSSVPDQQFAGGALPIPHCDVTIRQALQSDLPFVDRLQKMHTKMVGWMPTGQLEGQIKAGRVLVAEQKVEGSEERGENAFHLSTVTSPPSPAQPVGYCIASDRYFKHDDVGIIYQMNVMPGKQRGFVGASLLKAQFERSAYGCKLYCLWCAQDIGANRFWEAMGFVALAFRTGSAAKSRVHIFWQKRIRRGDETTPWWFPSETSGGAIRENRIVLPIPPGTHWSDAKPLVLPGQELRGEQLQVGGCQLLGEDGKSAKKRGKRSSLAIGNKQAATSNAIVSGGLRFASAVDAIAEKKLAKAKRERRPKMKNDPRYVAAARELRDRWLERLNATPLIGCGKYEMSRELMREQVVEGHVALIDRAIAA